jgi:hypothetical protein
MTVKRMYLVLLMAAVVAGCVLRLFDKGVAGFNSAGGLGETTGGVTALFLVGALVSTVLVVLSRMARAKTQPIQESALLLVPSSGSTWPPCQTTWVE